MLLYAVTILCENINVLQESNSAITDIIQLTIQSLHSERIEESLRKNLKEQKNNLLKQYFSCVNEIVEQANSSNYKTKIEEIKKASIKVFTLRDRSCNI